MIVGFLPLTINYQICRRLLTAALDKFVKKNVKYNRPLYAT